MVLLLNKLVERTLSLNIYARVLCVSFVFHVCFKLKLVYTIYDPLSLKLVRSLRRESDYLASARYAIRILTLY